MTVCTVSSNNDNISLGNDFFGNSNVSIKKLVHTNLPSMRVIDTKKYAPFTSFERVSWAKL